MSKQIHDETNRRKQVKFRADCELVEQFDHYVKTVDEYDNRADALRAAMTRMIGNVNESVAPLQPPTDEQLRTGYLAFVDLSNYDGIVPHEVATAELSTRLGKSQGVVERVIIGKLRKQNYIRQMTDWQGRNRAWKLRGMDR